VDEKSIRATFRLIGFLAAVGMWIISIYYSVDGFNITIQHMAWVGIAMGLIVTAIELVWNEEGVRKSFTLKIGGVCAYAYGIYTNIAGLAHAQGLGDLGAAPEKYLFPLILGILLEVMPEPLLVWSLSESVAHGDFLGNLFGSLGSTMQNGRRDRQMSFPQPGRAEEAREHYMQQGNRRDGDRRGEPAPPSQGAGRHRSH